MLKRILQELGPRGTAALSTTAIIATGFGYGFYESYTERTARKATTETNNNTEQTIDNQR